ncbi:MAG: GumC family protein [Candidatus Cloacimonadaceae bacterium]
MDNQLQNQSFQDEINLAEYFRIALQYRYLIVLIFVVVMAGTVFYTARQSKIYSASSRIMLEDQSRGADFLFMGAGGTGKNTINNQIEIIKSKPTLMLAWEIMKKYPDWDLFPIAASTNPAGRLGRVKVESKRETDLLTISIESTSPAEAQAAVNAIAEAIQQQNTQHARLEYITIREFLETQLDAISRRLQASENDLREFKNLNKLTELSAETTKLIEKSTELEAQLEAALTDMAVKARSVDMITRQLTEQDSILVDIDNLVKAPYVDELRKQVVETHALITKLITKNEYPLDHPQILLLNRELENARTNLDREIRKLVNVSAGSDPLALRNDLLNRLIQANIDMELARTRVDGLEQTREMYDKRIIALPNTELELARLSRNMLLDGKIHGMMMEKYEDAKIAEQAKVGNIRIIDYAERPTTPIKPKVSMNILVGLILGLGLGVGAAFLVHSLDTRLRTLEDMESFVKLPILGTIPVIHEAENRLQEFGQQIELAEGDAKEQLTRSMHYVMQQLVSYYAPKSPIAEAYRTLRTNIIARKPEGSTTLLVTSSGPKEGKTTSISNLAITLAQMSAKVVLVDMDMRRPTTHIRFGVEKENGSSDYLVDPDVKLSDIIKDSGIMNLSLITSGFVPPNPSELLASSRMDELIKDLKDNFDYILFDTPPVIAVTDALILTKKVDMTFVVIRSGHTEKGIVRRTKELMANVDAKIDGIIVNGIYVQKYYSKQNYYYYYYYYYGDEVPKKQKKNVSRFLRKNKPVS